MARLTLERISEHASLAEPPLLMALRLVLLGGALMAADGRERRRARPGK